MVNRMITINREVNREGSKTRREEYILPLKFFVSSSLSGILIFMKGKNGLKEDPADTERA